MAAPLIDRLRIKPGMRVLLLNPTPNFQTLLEPLPAGVTIDAAPDGSYNCVIVFVRSQAEADVHSMPATLAVKPGGVFWACYPKLTGEIKTDITRDKGWDALTGAGWRGVAQVSVDGTWSALRFRPETDIKPRGGDG